jgi:diacylglycerol diphosphate phosphatase / phosphatidate phosphatase
MNIFSRRRRYDDYPHSNRMNNGMAGGNYGQGDRYHNDGGFGNHTGHHNGPVDNYGPTNSQHNMTGGNLDSRHNGPMDNSGFTSGQQNMSGSTFNHNSNTHHNGPMGNNYSQDDRHHGANAYDKRTNGHHHRGYHHSKYNKGNRGRGGGGGFLQRRRNKSRSSRPLFDLETGNFNRRPSFGQWLKFTWLDIVTMAAMGAVGLGVYNADPAPSRSFPITFSDGEVVYPQFAYPLRKEIVPIWLAALLASLIPIFIILVMQIRIRSFWDVNNAIIGLLYSLICAAVFQVFIKWLIGGLRPHFLTVCDPDPAIVNAAQGNGNGFESIMFDRSICRGDRSSVNDALESFPSGHSTAAFAGFMFLYYYLNAKLKVFSNYHPAMWKLLATYAPVLGATLIAGAMTIDEFHHWYDVGFGAIIGTVMATSAYRMVYASVWDFRFNHIPLTRHTPFSYGAGAAGAGGFETTVFTRKAGWGYEEAFGGAPNDAAYNLRGQVTGFNTEVHSHDHHEKGAGLTGHHGHNDDAGVTKGHGHGLGNRHRHDDVEHNAATAAPGTGAGVASGTGVGNGHTGVDGTRNNDVDGTRHTGIDGTRHGVDGTGHTGVGGTGRTGVDGTGHGINDGTVRDSGRLDNTVPGTTGSPEGGNWGYPDGTGDQNRYRQHRKSMERKAVPAV